MGGWWEGGYQLSVFVGMEGSKNKLIRGNFNLKLQVRINAIPPIIMTLVVISQNTR